MLINPTIHLVFFFLTFSFNSNASPSPIRNSGENVVIRQMRDEDINECADIIREAYLQDCLKIEHATDEERTQMKNVPLETTRAAIHRFKNENGSVLFVAERADAGTSTAAAEYISNGARLSGCVRVLLNADGNSKDNGPFGQIGPFATRHGLQGTGIGTAMMRVAEQYAVDRWNVCEMQLDAHGIPAPVEGVVHEMPPLLSFYAKRGYRRIGKTCWFNPTTSSNYVTMPDHLCHLERMVKDVVCKPSEPSTKRMMNVVPMQQQFNNDISLNAIINEAVDWAHIVSLVNRVREHRERSDVVEIVPFALFPSPFPRHLYEEAQAVQKTLQLLYLRVSQDYEFLKTTLREAGETDNYLRHILDILDNVYQSGGPKQPINLILQRSDYMSHVNSKTGEYELKQIEVNLGAIGGNSRTQGVSQVHRRVFSKLGLSLDNLPVNESCTATGEALFKAWKQFNDPLAIIVFMSYTVVQGIFDQRLVEFAIEKFSSKIKIERLTLEECGEKLIMDPNDSSLSYNGRKVAIIYQRNFLFEKDWPTEKEWDIRRKLELSTAILTTNVRFDLASTKKVQQTLALPGVLERFLPDQSPELIRAVRQTFAGLWGLDKDDEETREVIGKAIEHPEQFVLKVNRDGGGNNFWDEQIAEKLRTMSRQERAGLILMEKLEPLQFNNYSIRSKEMPKMYAMTSELGINGYLLANAKTIIDNVQRGHMLRSKAADAREGGVRIGIGLHDSPFLF